MGTSAQAPATGDVRYVKRNVATENKALGFAKDKPFEVEAPQYGSMDAFIGAAGGHDKALEFVNGASATGAVNAARAIARNGETKENETVESARSRVISAAREAAHDYTPTGGERSMGLKKRAERAKEILASVRAGGRLPTEEELENLAALFGA